MKVDDTARMPNHHVLTITVNPALDVSLVVDQLIPDHKLRGRDARREPGGGGVNVARVLQRLGVSTRALVVAGGATGAELVSLLASEGVDVIDFPCAEPTRESFAVTEASTGRQYRISLPGAPVLDASGLYQLILDESADAGIVVLSGGLAPGLAADFYADVIAGLGPDTTTIVDTHGPPLAAVAARGASLIKPSQRELAELVGWLPRTADEIERAALEALERGGLGAILASRGPSGALLVQRDREPVWFRPPAVQPASTIGAGDSMVAGVAAALSRGEDLETAARFGVAVGTATVLTPGSALCDPADVSALVDQVAVTGPVGLE